MEMLVGGWGSTCTTPSTPSSPPIGTSRGKERWQFHLFAPKLNSAKFLFQIRSEDPSPSDLNAILFQILGSGAWKLGRCIPSECTQEDAAQVSLNHLWCSLNIEHCSSNKTGSLFFSSSSGFVKLFGADDRGRGHPIPSWLDALWLRRHQLSHCGWRGEEEQARLDFELKPTTLFRLILRLKIGEWWVSSPSLLAWFSSARWWTSPSTSST